MNLATALRTPRVRAGLAALVVVVVALVVFLATRGGDGDGSTSAAPGSTSSSSSAAGTSAPAATTTAAAPTTDPAVPTADPNAPPIDVDQLPPSLAPVALDATASSGDGVTGEVTDLTGITSDASGPGNIAGPALRVEIRLTNGTTDDLSLDGVTVTMTYGADATPASPLDDSSQVPFTGTVAAGQDAQGVYVFSVPEGARDSVSIQVSHAAGVPYMVFTGSAG